jgi:hypothetical protein
MDFYLSSSSETAACVMDFYLPSSSETAACVMAFYLSSSSETAACVMAFYLSSSSETAACATTTLYVPAMQHAPMSNMRVEHRRACPCELSGDATILCPIAVPSRPPRRRTQSLLHQATLLWDGRQAVLRKRLLYQGLPGHLTA